MGRPALNLKMTPVRLTNEQRQRIEQAVGPNRMAAFIREAVDEKLEREVAKQPPAND